jgi:hypothetical protein
MKGGSQCPQIYMHVSWAITERKRGEGSDVDASLAMKREYGLGVCDPPLNNLVGASIVLPFVLSTLYIIYLSLSASTSIYIAVRQYKHYTTA